MHLNDAALTQAVKTAVAANPSVNAVPLRIEVHEGEVRLFSDQTNADQRATLVAIARGVDGVSQVEDDMK
jgi:osmotically-inducible protein OsmY